MILFFYRYDLKGFSSVVKINTKRYENLKYKRGIEGKEQTISK